MPAHSYHIADNNSRLGVYRGHREVGVRKLGTARFELSNHLGNVLAVITDNIRLQADSAWADVVNSTDYYAFGSEMSTRTYSANTDYRYGFNGKEQDTDNTWGDDVYDYGFRIYNPKIGKFLSVDPLTKSYPMLTPYQFASNTPIWANDLDGLEASYKTKDMPKGGTLITITVRIRIKNSSSLTEEEVMKYSNKIKEFTENKYKGYDPSTKTSYKTNVVLVRNPELDQTDIWDHAFYMEFVNEIDKPIAQGRADVLGDVLINRFRVVPFQYDGYAVPDVPKLGGHEIGHTLGLRHPKDLDEKNDLDIDASNVMGYGKGSHIVIDQLKRIVETIDKTIKSYEKIKEDLLSKKTTTKD